MLTLDDDGIRYPAERLIIGSFPNSQHRVITNYNQSWA